MNILVSIMLWTITLTDIGTQGTNLNIELEESIICKKLINNAPD